MKVNSTAIFQQYNCSLPYITENAVHHSMGCVRQSLSTHYNTFRRSREMTGRDNISPAPPPRSIKSTRDKLRWRELDRQYLCDITKRSSNICIKIVDGIVGVGVFAAKNIPLGGKLTVSGSYSQFCKSEGAMRMAYSVEQRVKRNNKYYAITRALTGTLSFVNHSCYNHANIVPCHLDHQTATAWKVAYASRPIKRGTELTVDYKSTNLHCNKCKLTNAIK